VDTIRTLYELYDYGGDKYCEGYTRHEMIWDTTYFDDPIDTLNFGKYKSSWGSDYEVMDGEWKYYEDNDKV